MDGLGESDLSGPAESKPPGKETGRMMTDILVDVTQEVNASPL